MFRQRLIYVIIVAMMLPMVAHGQQTCRVLEDNYEMLRVQFSCGDVHFQPIKMGGRSFVSLSLEGMTCSQTAGDPNLPTFSQLVEAPLYEHCQVTTTEVLYDTIDLASLGITAPIAPMQPSRSKSDTTPSRLVINEKAYQLDAFTEMPLSLVEKVGIARDRNLARLQISPIRYNPVKGQIIVCRQATVTVHYTDADVQGSLRHFQRYHSPLFQNGATTLNNLYPKSVSTAAPVRYLIVAHSSFRGQLDDFVTWKRRKGFITDIVYTDESTVGSTTTSIQNYLQGQYNSATATNPAPTYLLLVGDVAQIPAFTGTTSSSHISDLYYVTWTTGDNIPDCYVGRFSAQDVSQLTPQIDKTLMYEQYTFADPTFLDRAVMVAGVDGGSSGDYGYTHADPAMDYAITHYVNGANGWDTIFYYKNNTSIVPNATHLFVGQSSSASSAAVRGYYNQGAGWINYSAHGSSTSWGTPQLTVTQIGDMSNTQKFGIMIGNCCLTNKFEVSTCFGEALLRRGNYCGAVGYIGGTNSTYWYEDFYWAVGLRNSSSIGPTMSMAYDASNLGGYDKLCHTHGEAYGQWAMSQGSLMMAGNMAVESSTSSRKLYYWEIYSLMGDPSLMPYLTQADSMVLTASSTIMQGTLSYPVLTVPYAYVALTDTTTHTLIASGFADASGAVTLTLPNSLPVGTYELAASAQQHRTAFRQVTVAPPNGPFVTATIAPEAFHPIAGDTTYMPLTLINVGNQTASNVILHFSTNLPGITLLQDTLWVDTIAAADTLVIDSVLAVHVAPTTADLTPFTLSTQMTWDRYSNAVMMPSAMSVYAPDLQVTFPDSPESIYPGTSTTLQVRIENQGHAPLPASHIVFGTDNWLTTLTPTMDSTFSLPVGATVQHSYTLTTDSLLPTGILLPLTLHIVTPSQPDDATLQLYVGTGTIETFEGNVFHESGWDNNSTYPWSIVNNGASVGSYCLKSYNGLGHNNTSEISITRNCPIPDSIRFYYNVSSETNYDKFHFYIDGNDLITASGQVDWTRASFPVTEGTHTFTFSYAKDYSVNRYDDCARIDHVILPKVCQPYRQEGDTVCAGSLYVLMGDTIDTQVPGTYYALDRSGDTLTLHRYVVLDTVKPEYTIEACDQYSWHDSLYTVSTEVIDTTVSPNGCAQVETLHLTIYYSVSDTIVDTIDGGPYQWNDEAYTTSGIYTQYLSTSRGCDSIVTLMLTINEVLGGINDAPFEGIRVYPSPTYGLIFLSERAQSIAVYDMIGRRVLEAEECQSIDLSKLASGVYTLWLKVEGKENIVRVIKR